MVFDSGNLVEAVSLMQVLKPTLYTIPPQLRLNFVSSVPTASRPEKVLSNSVIRSHEFVARITSKLNTKLF